MKQHVKIVITGYILFALWAFTLGLVIHYFFFK